MSATFREPRPGLAREEGRNLTFQSLYSIRMSKSRARRAEPETRLRANALEFLSTADRRVRPYGIERARITRESNHLGTTVRAFSPSPFPLSLSLSLFLSISFSLFRLSVVMNSTTAEH